MITKKIIDIIKNDGIISLLKKTISFFTRKIFVRLPNPLKNYFASKIRKFRSNDVNEVMRYSFDVLGLLLRPIQIPEEFIELLKVFKNTNPRIVMEIGTATGGSLLSFCKLAQDDASIISLDLPGGKFGGGYPEWEISIFKMFKQENQNLYLLRSDSHLKETLLETERILNGRKIDFLFIDGDHEYDGVKKDFEMYSPLVRKGGVIAFHDIAPNGLKQYTGGVPTFWKEVEDKYQHKEFINDINQGGFGIGCLFV